ncbi:MAG: hypothetical protein EOM68_12695 [Spirochaetia bacterium]|nr:hypothetical protein [Spirochaetia bacterium]
MEKLYKNDEVRQQVEKLLKMYPYCHIENNGLLLAWDSVKYSEDIYLGDIDSIDFHEQTAVLHSLKGTRFGYNEVTFYEKAAVLPHNPDVIYYNNHSHFKDVTILSASELKGALLKLGFRINSQNIIWTQHFGLRFDPNAPVVALYPFGTSTLNFDQYALWMLDGITWSLEAGSGNSFIKLICKKVICKQN